MKWLAIGAVVLFLLPLALLAPVIGLLASPWSPFWLSGVTGQIAAAPPEEGQRIDPALFPIVAGGVTDAFRYQLARGAGFSHSEAIVATAISIAENGSGNPTALSPRNRDGSQDFCLMQVNSAWWQRFGGQQALANPQTCFNAAHTIYGIQGWCAWSTYESSCGIGHTGSYRAYLSRAKAASEVQPLPGEA